MPKIIPHALPGRKVVITGMGVVSSLGHTTEAVKQALYAGKSGIVYLDERKKMGFRSGLSGSIVDFLPRYPLDRRYRKTLPDFGIWAWDAICQALEQAQLEHGEIAGNERIGLIFGNDSSAVTAVEQCELLKRAENTREIGSGHIFRLLTSTISLNLSTKLRIRGSSWTVSGACASGAMSVGQAAELIARGSQDIVICGGAQEISWQSMCSFDALGAFSILENEPHLASRPFDDNRYGLIPSGGAAALILETEESAQRRGAEILAEVCGYGTSSDGYHLSVPTGKGLLRAMQIALDDAGLTPGDVDLVMAHATSTPAGDEKEAEALCSLFAIQSPGEGPFVAATKALTGHEFWMAGASQVLYGLLTSRDGVIPGHPNLEKRSNSAALLKISKETIRFSPKIMLCNAAGFGGVNAVLVIRVRNAC
jgi:3-oxoacyl-[acyl-carrier-protein] synthase-1